MSKPRAPSPEPTETEASQLRHFVDRISHRAGAALSLMEKTGATLPQVLLLARVRRAGSASISELAGTSPKSAPAMSQMVDRLVRQNWLARAEDCADRRRKAVSLTKAGARLLGELEKARTKDYAAGLAPLSAPLRAELQDWLDRALRELDEDERL